MTEPPRHRLMVEALDAARFAPFGDVIEARDDGRAFEINDGWARRHDDLARIDTDREGGRPRLSLFRARARPLPLRLLLMERHRLGSQAFFATTPRRFLVVVAPPGEPPAPTALRAFMAAPGQGVNYAAGTWHHPLIALDADTEFLVIDRGAPQDDCEVWRPQGPQGLEIWVDG